MILLADNDIVGSRIDQFIKSGINREAWAMETGLDYMLVTDLLIQFSEAGKIAMDGDMLLVIKALQHRRLSARDHDYAINAITRRYGARSPRLVSLCFKINSDDSAGVLGVPESSLSESLSDQNQIKDKSSIPRTARAGRATPRKRKPEPEQYVTLATELDWYRSERVEKYNIPHGGFKNEPEETARILRLLVETDKFDIGCILPALAWAWRSTRNGWGPNSAS